MGQTQSQCKTHLESLNPPFLVTDIDTSAILQYTPNSDHLSQNISLWCSLSSLNDTSFVPKIGDSSRLRNKSMLSPVVKLFFFFLLHAEQSLFPPPSGLFFIKNQSKSQRGTFQTPAALEADDEARVNIRVVKLWWITKWIRIAAPTPSEKILKREML